MEYVRKLQFDEVPDYEFLREMLTKVMRVHGVVDDGVYDWHLLNGVFFARIPLLGVRGQ